MKVNWKYLFGFLIIITVLVWLAVLTYPGKNLKLIACNVGQGDAILAQIGHQQLLVDGGPGAKAAECLSRYMPFWDRTVEAVLMTHPEKDHYLGLVKVFKDYKVKYFLTSGLDSDSQEFGVLKNQVGGEGGEVVIVREGQSIRFGLIHLDILHPSDRFIAENAVYTKYADVTENAQTGLKVLSAYTTKKNKNDFSVVSLLSYGDFDALLTGDIEDDVSDLVAEDLEFNPSASRKDVEYLKVPHHGSKNGLSQRLLDLTNPKIAVISDGMNNSYGHPHKEVLDMLSGKNINILRTDMKGDIVVETNGKDYWIIK